MDRECCTNRGEQFGGKSDGKRPLEKKIYVDERIILKCNLPSYTVNYTHAQGVTICCHDTDLVHVNGHD